MSGHRTVTEHMDVVQLTPRGPGCSIVVGSLPSQRQMAPGSLHGLQLRRGVARSEVTVSDERDGGRLFGLDDPDGNSWAVRELRVRAERPLTPRPARADPGGACHSPRAPTHRPVRGMAANWSGGSGGGRVVVSG